MVQPAHRVERVVDFSAEYFVNSSQGGAHHELRSFEDATERRSVALIQVAVSEVRGQLDIPYVLLCVEELEQFCFRLLRGEALRF